jgi:hypothetical protein
MAVLLVQFKNFEMSKRRPVSYGAYAIKIRAAPFGPTMAALQPL